MVPRRTPAFIPVFEEPKHKGYDAKGKEFELAAIGDSGEGHTAYYWDELARITGPRDRVPKHRRRAVAHLQVRSVARRGRGERCDGIRN